MANPLANYVEYHNDIQIPLLAHVNHSHERLYIVNKFGTKLLQFITSNNRSSDASEFYAQIKIIPYSTDKAIIHRDGSLKLKSYKLYSGVEITYHGGAIDQASPKIHLKAQSISRNRYRTLINQSLSLPSKTNNMLPIGSLEPGRSLLKQQKQKTRKKSHIHKLNTQKNVRYDFYLTGSRFDLKQYVNSFLFLNLLFSQDYLSTIKNCRLSGGKIIPPIKEYKMNNFSIWVRCSMSPHTGTPRMIFYDNENYFYKFLNRKVAYKNDDGSFYWTTGIDREKEIRG